MKREQNEKIMYGRNFMCRGSGRKHTVRSGIWEQMRPGTAYGKCALCGIVRTWIRSRSLHFAQV